MAITTAAALIASAVIGAVATQQAAKKQSRATREAEEARQTAADIEQVRLERIQAETKPTELTAEGIQFGARDTDIGDGGVSEFLVQKKTSKLGFGTAGTSGLGFTV